MSAARAIECRKPALQSRSGHTAPDLQFRGAVALWLELVAQRAAARERGSGTETGARRHLLTRQQTLALLEDQMGGHGSPAPRTRTRPMPSGGRTCRGGRSDSWRWTCTRSLNLLQPPRGDALPHLMGAHRPHAESGEQLYVLRPPRAAAPFQLITIGIADADDERALHPTPKLKGARRWLLCWLHADHPVPCCRGGGRPGSAQRRPGPGPRPGPCCSTCR